MHVSDHYVTTGVCCVVRFSSTNAIVLVNDDYHDSCMKDIRYNGHWLPMDRASVSIVLSLDVRAGHHNITALYTRKQRLHIRYYTRTRMLPYIRHIARRSTRNIGSMT